MFVRHLGSLFAKLTLLSALLHGSMVSAAESPSALALAERFYKEQRFSKACFVLQSELKNNPRNASAHYLLGNSFLALKSFAQARDEYRLAAILDPKGQAGEYSRVALSLLDQEKKAGEQTSSASSPSGARAQPAGDSGEDRIGMHSSIRAISAETDSRRAVLLPEIIGKLEESFRDTVSECGRQENDFEKELEIFDSVPTSSHHSSNFKRDLSDKKLALKNDFDNKRAPLSDSLYKTREEVAKALSGVGHSERSSEQLWSNYMSELKAWFDTWRNQRSELTEFITNYPQLQSPDDTTPSTVLEWHLKKFAVEQNRVLGFSEEVYHTYAAKAANIEDNAKAIDETYRKQIGSEPVKLVPKGTNIYARSYQVTPEPSDQPLPFLAKPLKLPVPTTQHQLPGR